MRDPNRIGPTLFAIEMLWRTYPDLRLGQLILNLTADDAAYYIEDDDLRDLANRVRLNGWENP